MKSIDAPHGACVLVAIKARAQCKSRLAEVLAPAARVQLVRSMLEAVLGGRRNAQTVRQILVVSPERDCVPAEIPVLADTGGGLNGALSAAHRRCVNLVATRWWCCLRTCLTSPRPKSMSWCAPAAAAALRSHRMPPAWGRMRSASTQRSPFASDLAPTARGCISSRRAAWDCSPQRGAAARPGIRCGLARMMFDRLEEPSWLTRLQA